MHTWRPLIGLIATVTLMACGDDSSHAPDVSSDAAPTLDLSADTDPFACELPSWEIFPNDIDMLDDTAGDISTVPPDTDTTTPDTDPGPDTSPPASCLDFAAAGERYPVGDNCNYCTCNDDGAATCTNRLCRNEKPSCTYDGVTYPYAARFSATDGCNICVCATSGLACTRRCPDVPQEGAILLESLDEICGENPAFTARAVLDGLPTADLDAPFFYDRKRDFYPETRPDTTGSVRIRYEGGHAVCRIPMPTQPAIDIEAVVEFTTADGAFNEGLHTYLRRNDFGFVDAWHVHAGFPVGGLDGDYTPDCLLPNGFAFMVQVNADGSYLSEILKVCEESIAVPVGRLEMLVDE